MSSRLRRLAPIVVVGTLLVLASLPALAATTTFSNTASIAIPATGTGDPAGPYPSTIDVTGVAGLITDVNVTVTNLSHTYPRDVNVLLVGPAGQNVLLMDDNGTSTDVTNVTLTFDDAAAAAMPAAGVSALTSGTYRPAPSFSACEPAFAFTAPAPAGPYGAALSVFNGTDPKGSWSLFILDDCGSDSGTLSGGWSLEITAGSAPTITVPADITVAADPGQAGAVVNFVATATDLEDGAITPDCSTTSGSFFPIGTTTVNCTATDSDTNTASDSFTVTVTDSESPVLTVPANIEVNATGTDGADVTYTASATDNSGAVPVSCVPPSGSTFPVGTTTVTCTVTDASNNSVSGSFTVTVLGADDLLAQLHDDTIDLVTNSGAERALVATVDQAIQASNNGNTWGTYMALLKYVIQMDRYVDSHAVSPSAAQQWLTQARQVLDTIL